MLYEAVARVEMGVARQFVHFLRLAQHLERSGFHQCGIGFVEIFLHLAAVCGMGLGLALSREGEAVHHAVVQVMAANSRLTFRLSATEQHLLAFALYGYDIDVADVMQLRGAKCDVDHRRGFYQNLFTLGEQQLLMRQYVRCAILEGCNFASVCVASRGVDKYQVEATVLLLQPFHAVATVDVDIL